MQRTFFSKLVLLLVLNLLIKPIWILGVEVGVQRILGPEVYGNYFALLNFSFLFMVLMDFGLNSFNNRQVARNPSRMAEHLASIGTLKLIMGVIVLVLIQAVAHVVGFSPDQRRLLWGVSAILFLQSFLLFIRSNISGIQWYRADVLISVLDRVISILLVGGLIWLSIDGLSLTIERYIWAQIIAYCIGISVAAGLLWKRTRQIRFDIDLKKSWRTLKSSFYYALLVLLVLSYYKIDAVMIERICVDGDRQAGIYAQSFKLLEAGIMIAYLFSTLLMPMFSRMIKKREDVTSLIRLSDQLLLIPIAIVVVGAAIFREQLMELLYLEETNRSAEAFLFLIISLLPIAATYIYGTLITAKGDLKTLNIIAGLGVLINVLGNAIMIPKSGIVGAATVTLVTQSIVALAQVIVAHRSFKLKVGSKGILRILIFSFGLIAVGQLIYGSMGNWLVELGALVLIAMFLAVVLRLFSFSKLGELLRLREAENA